MPKKQSDAIRIFGQTDTEVLALLPKWQETEHRGWREAPFRTSTAKAVRV